MSRICENVPFNEYVEHEGLNASAIKQGRTSMLHMHNYLNAPRTEPTPAMVWGSIVHLAILEPYRVMDEVVVWDESKRTKAYKEFKADHEGKYIITSQEVENIGRMVESVYAHPEAKQFLDESQKEVSLFADGNYGKGKARVDAMDGSMICDLKTTSAIHPIQFQKQAWSLGYFTQMGWYAEMYEQCHGHAPDAYIIALESKAPFDVMFLEVTPSALKHGRDEAVKIAKLYHITKTTECAYKGVCDGIQPLTLPEYAVASEDKLDFS